VAGRKKRCFPTSTSPHRLWSPLSYLFNEHHMSVRGIKVTGTWSWPQFSMHCLGYKQVES
jgi:hypothetical protein